MTVQLDCSGLQPAECAGVMAHEEIHVRQAKVCAAFCGLNFGGSFDAYDACWAGCWEDDRLEDVPGAVEETVAGWLGR